MASKQSPNQFLTINDSNLEEFLREKKVLNALLREATRDGLRGETISCIDSTFRWNCTENGYRYWSNLSSAYLARTRQ